MEKLVTVKAMQERYGCSRPTARKYIRQCDPHMENPLATTEQALCEWEEERTVYKKTGTHERVVVPRRR